MNCKVFSLDEKVKWGWILGYKINSEYFNYLYIKPYLIHRLQPTGSYMSPGNNLISGHPHKRITTCLCYVFIYETCYLVIVWVKNTTCPWSVITYTDDVLLHTTMWSAFFGKRWMEFTEASPPWKSRKAKATIRHRSNMGELQISSLYF